MDTELRMNSTGKSLENWLTLWHVRGIGPALFHQCLQQIGQPELILKAPASKLRACGLSQQVIVNLNNIDESSVQSDIRWASEPNHFILTLFDARYPQRLRDISQSPPLLYVNGNPEILNDPQLAMVGTRNPSHGGLETAYAFAAALTKAGICVTSGLASGIDAQCHRAALKAGGPTIAVAATGLDRVYPAEHRELARKIVENGAIVSEFPIGTTPRAEYFPRRNRILSGLTLGTLVIEAALRSGSLITARYAMEQSREVFAIPGSIHNPMSKGCHQLIRQGAKLTEAISDILEELASQIQLESEPMSAVMNAGESNSIADFDGDQRLLFDALGFDPTPIDVIVERTGLTAEAVSSMLLIMELEGHVASNGNRYHRTTGLNST